MKLTEAQARIAREMEAGAQMVRGDISGSYYLSRKGGRPIDISSRSAQRMMEAGHIRATGERGRLGSTYELTEAGRTALSAKEAE